ncbi:MAG: nucleoside 2-deoxyribosyltransferase domain-containing protein [Cytophagales bacterium]|nr:nucleoside 2-deoxyribosyltransferase domain-containing protein [Armatimonadota bacterium]
MNSVVALSEAARGVEPMLFLAGGISGCGDWQREMTALLSDTSLTLLNPRRPDFPIDDEAAARTQIEWEFRHLRLADAILFWFPHETLCPITLFELGAGSRSAVPLFVGTHPDYQRRTDVIVQLSLARPEVSVVGDLASLATQVRRWAAGND